MLKRQINNNIFILALNFPTVFFLCFWRQWFMKWKQFSISYLVPKSFSLLLIDYNFYDRGAGRGNIFLDYMRYSFGWWFLSAINFTKYLKLVVKPISSPFPAPLNKTIFIQLFRLIQNLILKIKLKTQKY